MRVGAGVQCTDMYILAFGVYKLKSFFFARLVTYFRYPFSNYKLTSNKRRYE